ncbi:MAG: S16 family serine protease [Polyangiaceae bacterium]
MDPPGTPLEVAERTEETGVVTGLALTSVGGEILFVATRHVRHRVLQLTGQLGDVMYEDTTAASYFAHQR